MLQPFRGSRDPSFSRNHLIYLHLRPKSRIYPPIAGDPRKPDSVAHPPAIIPKSQPPLFPDPRLLSQTKPPRSAHTFDRHESGHSPRTPRPIAATRSRSRSPMRPTDIRTLNIGPVARILPIFEGLNEKLAGFMTHPHCPTFTFCEIRYFYLSTANERPHQGFDQVAQLFLKIAGQGSVPSARAR